MALAVDIIAPIEPLPARPIRVKQDYVKKQCVAKAPYIKPTLSPTLSKQMKHCSLNICAQCRCSTVEPATACVWYVRSQHYDVLMYRVLRLSRLHLRNVLLYGIALLCSSVLYCRAV